MEKIKIIDTTPRDGIQSQSTIVSTSDKIELVKLLLKSNLKEIEVFSFANKKLMPQFADRIAFFSMLEKVKYSDSNFMALVTSSKFIDEALDAPIDGITLISAATDSFATQNLRRDVSSCLDDMRLSLSRCSTKLIKMRASISVAFGCPFEGKVSLSHMERQICSMLDMGISEISLCDTAALATPEIVKMTLDFVLKRLPVDLLSLHLHISSKDMALSLVENALEYGVYKFESSIGEIGGCPVVEANRPNIDTELLNNFLTEKGYETGIDKNNLKIAASFVEKFKRRI